MAPPPQADRGTTSTPLPRGAAVDPAASCITRNATALKPRPHGYRGNLRRCIMFLSLPSRNPRSKPRPRRTCPLLLEALEERFLLAVDMVLHWNQVALQAAVVDHGIGAPCLQFCPPRTSRPLPTAHAPASDPATS